MLHTSYSSPISVSTILVESEMYLTFSQSQGVPVNSTTAFGAGKRLSTAVAKPINHHPVPSVHVHLHSKPPTWVKPLTKATATPVHPCLQLPASRQSTRSRQTRLTAIPRRTVLLQLSVRSFCPNSSPPLSEQLAIKSTIPPDGPRISRHLVQEPVIRNQSTGRQSTLIIPPS